MSEAKSRDDRQLSKASPCPPSKGCYALATHPPPRHPLCLLLSRGCSPRHHPQGALPRAPPRGCLALWAPAPAPPPWPRETPEHRASPGSAAPLENTAFCPYPAPARQRPDPRGAEVGAAVGVGGGAHSDLGKLQAAPAQAGKARLVRRSPDSNPGRGERAHLAGGSKGQEKAPARCPLGPSLVLASGLLPVGPPHPLTAPTTWRDEPRGCLSQGPSSPGPRPHCRAGARSQSARGPSEAHAQSSPAGASQGRDAHQ